MSEQGCINAVDQFGALSMPVLQGVGIMALLVRFFHRGSASGGSSFEDSRERFCSPPKKGIRPDQEHFLTLTPKHLAGKRINFPGQRVCELSLEVARNMVQSAVARGKCGLQVTQHMMEAMLIAGCAKALAQFHEFELPWPQAGETHWGITILEPTDEVLEITPFLCLSDLQRLFHCERTGVQLEIPDEVSSYPHFVCAPPNHPHTPFPVRVGFQFHLVSIPRG